MKCVYYCADFVSSSPNFISKQYFTVANLETMRNMFQSMDKIINLIRHQTVIRRRSERERERKRSALSLLSVTAETPRHPKPLKAKFSCWTWTNSRIFLFSLTPSLPPPHFNFPLHPVEIRFFFVLSPSPVTYVHPHSNTQLRMGNFSGNWAVFFLLSFSWSSSTWLSTTTCHYYPPQSHRILQYTVHKYSVIQCSRFPRRKWHGIDVAN